MNTNKKNSLTRFQSLAPKVALVTVMVSLFASTPVKTQTATLSVTAPITTARYQARTMKARLSGVVPAIDDASLTPMENLIAAGNYLGAANLAVQDPGFVNIVIRNIATVESTRALDVTQPLNDFVATYMGIVRDNHNAKDVLTGNYLYQGDPAKIPAGVRQNGLADIAMSNNHYADIDAQVSDVQSVLKQVPQMAVANGSSLVAHPEPAGLLTSRQWGNQHLIMGTNRRAVQFAFSEFLCITIDQFADSSGPDNMVSQDVDRYPQGSNGVFEAKCKSCHTMLDFMRPAYAHFDFNTTNNYVSNLLVDASSMKLNPPTGAATGLPSKYYSNNTVFPPGYVVPDTSFVNNATNASNTAYFGWRGAMRGSGIQAFAAMLANSQAFSRCFVKKAFESVCNRDPIAGTEDALVQSFATGFEGDNYNVRDLFAKVAANPSCLGQ